MYEAALNSTMMETPTDDNKTEAETMEATAADDATKTELPTTEDPSSEKKEDSTMNKEGVEDMEGRKGSSDSNTGGKDIGKEEESPAMLAAAPNCEEDDDGGIPKAATGKRSAPEEDRSHEGNSKRPKLEDDKMEEEEDKELESESPANAAEDKTASASNEETDTASHSHAIRQRLMALLGQTTKSSGSKKEMTPPAGASSKEGNGAAAGTPKKDNTSALEDKVVAAVIGGSISSHSSTPERDMACDAEEDISTPRTRETTPPVDTSDGDKAPVASDEGEAAAVGNPKAKKSEHDLAEIDNSSSSGGKDAVLVEDAKPSAVFTKEGESGLNVTGETIASQAAAFKADSSDEEVTKAAMKVPGIAGDTRQDDINKVMEILKCRKQAEENNDAFMDGWYNWVNDLLDYHKKHGHCQVRDAESHALYNWLKRQRVMFRKGKLEEDKLTILRLLKTNGFEAAKITKAKPPPEPVSKKPKKAAKPMSEKKRLKAMRNAGRNANLARAVARAGEGGLAASLTESVAHTGEGEPRMPMTGHDAAAAAASHMAQQQISQRRDPAGSFLLQGMLPQDGGLGRQLSGGALPSIQGTGRVLNAAAEAQFQAQDLNNLFGLPPSQQAVLLLLQQQQAQQRAAQEELQRRQRQQDLLLLQQMLQRHPRQPPRGDP